MSEPAVIREETEVERLAKGLTFMEEQFCLEYLANGENGTRAMLVANPDVTEGSAATLAWRWLKRAEIKAYLHAVRNEKLRERHIGPDRILAELADMAGFDLGTILDDVGRIDRSKLKTAAKQLQSVEVGGAKTKVKGPDRLAAFRLLMDHLGMLKQTQVNVQVNMDFGARMAARRQRALEGR